MPMTSVRRSSLAQHRGLLTPIECMRLSSWRRCGRCVAHSMGLKICTPLARNFPRGAKRDQFFTLAAEHGTANHSIHRDFRIAFIEKKLLAAGFSF